jgi:hypothetical protein
MAQRPDVFQQFAVPNQDGRIELFVAGMDGRGVSPLADRAQRTVCDWALLGGDVSEPFAIQKLCSFFSPSQWPHVRAVDKLRSVDITRTRLRRTNGGSHV